MIKLLNSWCTRCSETGAHLDHFLLHINRGSMVEASWLDLAMSSIGFGLLFAAFAFAVAGIVTIFR